MQRRAEEHLYWDEMKLNCNKKKKNVINGITSSLFCKLIKDTVFVVAHSILLQKGIAGIFQKGSHCV